MPRDSVAAFRAAEYDEHPVLHLDSASYGLFPRRTVAALHDLAERRTRGGAIDDAELDGCLDRARRAAASLVAVDPCEISLVPNTTYGLHLGVGLVAAGPPGVIVVSEGEFPANVLPWMALESRGFEVRIVPLRAGLPDEAALRSAALEPEVRAVAVSAVQFNSGYRVELGELGEACRRGGTLFVVDAIQALGTLPLEAEALGIDVLATGAQKWLLSPWGSGFAWVPARHRDRIVPPVVSWLAVEGGSAFSAASGYALDYLGDGRRFEPATLGTQDYLGMALSIEGLMEVGLGRIREHLRGLHAVVQEWAAERDEVRVIGADDPERRGGILSLSMPDPEAVRAALEARDIVVAVRDGLLRISPHMHVTVEDMVRTVEALDAAVRG